MKKTSLAALALALSACACPAPDLEAIASDCRHGQATVEQEACGALLLWLEKR